MSSPLVHPYTVRAVRFTPDGSLLACACFDGNVHLWDTVTWKRVGRLKVGSLCSALAISRAGMIAGGERQGPDRRLGCPVA